MYCNQQMSAMEYRADEWIVADANVALRFQPKLES